MKRALLFLCFVVCLFRADAATRTASVVLRCKSFESKPYPSSNPNWGSATNFCTTYDGRSDVRPLTQSIEYGKFMVSSEMRPRLNVPGVYEADFIIHSYYYGWLLYGSMTANMPTTDLDNNGLPDFLQKENAVDQTFSSVASIEWATSVFVVTRPISNFSVRFTRGANQEQGVWTSVDAATGETSTGTWIILHGVGAFNYTRGNPNLAQLSLSRSPELGQTGTSSATTTFNVINKDQIEIPEFFTTSSSNQTWRTSGTTVLNRKGNKYVGPLTLTDGGLETSWVDYANWILEITDTNDEDHDGIPDLSDMNEAPLAFKSVKMVVPQRVQVQAGVRPGEAYSLLCSANFKTWLVVTNFTASSETVSLTDSVHFPQQFYRLKTPP